MDVLLTGNLSAVTREFCKQLCANSNLVLAAEEIDKSALPKKAIPFSFGPSDPLFEKLLKSYSFNTIIFFAT
jgi:hypothetical protein